MARRRGRVNPLRDEELEQVLEGVLNTSDIEDDPYRDDDLDDDFVLEIRNQTSSSSSDDDDPPIVRRGLPVPRRGTRSRRVRGGRGSQGQVRERSPIHPLEDESEWEDIEFDPVDIQLMQPSYLPVQRDNFSKIDYFKQYVDDSVIENMVEKSNWSYFSRNVQSLDLSFKECKTYLAVTMIMSCINYPNLRMYWSREFRVPIIADNISRNRFMQLRNAIKLVLDEEITPEQRIVDKLWKVRPLIDAVLKGCQMQEKTKHLSADEMMIPFQGTCGLKQYCPGKPNPVGLKAFVLATPQGLVCDFHVYQGSTTYPEFEDKQFGLGEKAILSLTKDLVPGHIIYCDRYFTSEKLILALKDKGIMCTGTIMKNRVPRSAKAALPDDKLMKKRSRGSWAKLVHKTNKLVITKWLDSKPVTFLSSIHSDKVIDSCQRWSKIEKKYVDIPRPEVVKNYNTNMGGVDMADRMIAVCPFRYRTLKWTQRVISHFIDLAISNSWILYRQDQLVEGERLATIQQMRPFKLDIAKAMLEESSAVDENLSDEGSQRAGQNEENDQCPQLSHFRKRNAPIRLPSQKTRSRGAVHMPEVNDIQKKCRNAGCKNKTKIRCLSCGVHLCLTRERNCFKKFHTQP